MNTAARAPTSTRLRQLGFPVWADDRQLRGCLAGRVEAFLAKMRCQVILQSLDDVEGLAQLPLDL
ncbi:hypothetical protein, partial [Mycolicibacterium porcinum]|uniref:hypothetical protein n=1 Tax=Mycolicibacterium porcinum TaxID=39693 RepID=UPI00197C921F